MALNKTALKDNFKNLFSMTGDPTIYTKEYVAGKWKDFYHEYAQQAADPLGNGVLGMDEDALYSKLLQAFSQYTPEDTVQKDPSITTNLIREGIDGYWAGVTLDISNQPPGAAVPLANVVDSTPGDLAFSGGPISDPDAGAVIISDMLHNKTTAVKTKFTYLDGMGNPGTYNGTLV